MSKNINLDNLTYYDSKLKSYIGERIVLDKENSVLTIVPDTLAMNQEYINSDYTTYDGAGLLQVEKDQTFIGMINPNQYDLGGKIGVMFNSDGTGWIGCKNSNDAPPERASGVIHWDDAGVYYGTTDDQTGPGRQLATLDDIPDVTNLQGDNLVIGNPDSGVYLTYSAGNGFNFIDDVENRPLTKNGVRIPNIDEIPVKKGEGLDSLISTNGNAEAISQDAVAIGQNVIAGIKGFWIKGFYKDSASEECYISISDEALSSDQYPPFIIGTGAPSLGSDIIAGIAGNNWQSGMSLSIRNAQAFDKCVQIIDCIYDTDYTHVIYKISQLPFEGTRIQYTSGTTTSYQTVTGTYFDEFENNVAAIENKVAISGDAYTIYNIDAPNSGVYDNGIGAVCFGRESKALQDCAVAFGLNNEAIGKYSFVAGRNNVGGYGSFVNGRGNIILTDMSYGEGNGNVSSGDDGYIHLEGRFNQASGGGSHTEGRENLNDKAHYTHIEGYHNEAQGTSVNLFGHVEGGYNLLTSSALFGHVEGGGNTITERNTLSQLAGHIEGIKNSLTGSESAGHIEGTHNTAVDSHSIHIEGRDNIADKAHYAHLEGVGNQFNSNGNRSEVHIEGLNNKITVNNGYSQANLILHVEGANHQNIVINGNYNHVEGNNNSLSGGDASHIEGSSNKNEGGSQAHVEGASNQVLKNSVDNKYEANVHIEGRFNIGRANSCHVEGSNNEAESVAHWSHVGGRYSHALHEGSFVHGLGLRTDNPYQTVVGTYNAYSTAENGSDYLFVVGSGTEESAPMNSFTVDANGQIWARSTAWLPKVANGSASIGLSNNGFTFADSTDSGITFTANDLRTALSSSGANIAEWTTHVQAHYMDHGEVIPPTFTCSDFYDREFKIIIETYESSMIASSAGGETSSTITTFDGAAYTFSPIYYEGTPIAIRYTDTLNGMPKIHMTVPVLVKNNNSITLQLIDTESGKYIQDTGYCPAINIFILSRSTNMY